MTLLLSAFSPAHSAHHEDSPTHQLQEDCVATLQGWLEDPASAGNPTACLVAGLVYFAEGNHVEALKACDGSSASLEMQALSVQVYLAMDRADQAEKTVKVRASS